MTEGGPVIIDWDGAAHGDPVADIAWMWIQWATGTVPWNVKNLQDW